MSLGSAHKGYYYQDILSSYFVAKEIAEGRLDSEFLFDVKKTETGNRDKFDDLSIFRQEKSTYYQFKYSDDINSHLLTKTDFSEVNKYGLALQDLYTSWKCLNTNVSNFKICLAWGLPQENDDILKVIQFVSAESIFPESKCIKFNIDSIWPENEVVSNWRGLRNFVKNKKIKRTDFAAFLNSISIEICMPKSSLLESFNTGLDYYYKEIIERIGIGIYPNDTQTPSSFASNLCGYIRRKAAEGKSERISCKEIAKTLGIKFDFGGVEENFPIDETKFVKTQNRVNEIIDLLNTQDKIVISGEPGSGKSWLIKNIEETLSSEWKIVKHYCFTGSKDVNEIKRITSNVFFGSVLNQLNELHLLESNVLTYKYASNFENITKALNEIKTKTVLIIDGIDHIYRIYNREKRILSENEIEIVNALASIKINNPNLKIIVLSQPIDELRLLSDYSVYKLSGVDNSFTVSLLEKYSIKDIKLKGNWLSEKITEKANGNSLYINYLIKGYLGSPQKESLSWLEELPAYDYNLGQYYSFLFEKLQDFSNNIAIYLAGVNFSLTIDELKEITKLGKIVEKEISILYPILNNSISYGFSIYHESFKRFLLEKYEENEVEIKDIIKASVLPWLESKDFFKDTKAYCSLLQLYDEFKEYEKISKTICSDFLFESIRNIQPVSYIRNNHDFQLKSLQFISDFSKDILIVQQTKRLDALDNFDNELLGAYLLTAKERNNEDIVYNFLYPSERLDFSVSNTIQILSYFCLHNFNDLHWSIIKNKAISYDDLNSVIIKLLANKEEDKAISLFDLKLEVTQFEKIIDKIEWFILWVDSSVIKSFPKVITRILKFYHSEYSFFDILQSIDGDYFGIDCDTKKFKQLFWKSRYTKDSDIEQGINLIKDRSWFYNWICYAIQICKLSNTDYSDKEILNAFSFLIRDVEPFKGKPRTCDLYGLEDLIHKTFCIGLNLCKDNKDLRRKCFSILEKVTETETFLSGSVCGPLTRCYYTELVNHYFCSNYLTIPTIKEIYNSYTYYHYISKTLFLYAYTLFREGKNDIAEQYFLEGIKSFLGYGVHKDRSFSDLLDVISDYQKYTSNLSKNEILNLEKYTFEILHRTDGRDVRDYPEEWFICYSDLYPREGIEYLIQNILEANMVNGYFENNFKYLLQEKSDLFSPDIWFLLWLSLPLLESDKIISLAFEKRGKIDTNLLSLFDRWMITRPFVFMKGDYNYKGYSSVTIEKYKNIYNFDVPKTVVEHNINQKTHNIIPFEAKTYEDALAFLEKNDFFKNEIDLHQFEDFILKESDFNKQKQLIISFAKKNQYRYRSELITFQFDENTDLYIFSNLVLYVFTNDGGFAVLTNTIYLEKAYKTNHEKCLVYLKEILGFYINAHPYAYKLSSNLLCGLVKVGYAREDVSNIYKIIEKSIKNLFPDLIYNPINENWFDFSGYTEDEMAIILLISRLKTYTGEKNRNIFLGLKYLALTSPEKLIKPFEFIFSHAELLLPIQRSLLLQIIYEDVAQNLISNSLIKILSARFPTYIYQEDYYIRKICNLGNSITLTGIKQIIYPKSEKDAFFLALGNDKYGYLEELFGVLDGSYNEYQESRKKSSKELNHYSLRTEEIFAPIVNFSDIAYQIINKHLYSEMVNFEKDNVFLPEKIRFNVERTIQTISSLDKRPLFLPKEEDFVKKTTSADSYMDDEWVLIASHEQKYVAAGDFKKVMFFSQCSLVADRRYEQPISRRFTYDEFEKSIIWILSGFLVHSLKLSCNEDIFQGIYWTRDNEVVAKVITWNENYMGSIDSGYEIPSESGSALLVKKELFMEINKLYSGQIIILQKINE